MGRGKEARWEERRARTLLDWKRSTQRGPSFCLSKARHATAASSVSKTAYASPDGRPSARRIRWTLSACSAAGRAKNSRISSTVHEKGSPRSRSTPR